MKLKIAENKITLETASDILLNMSVIMGISTLELMTLAPDKLSADW